MPRSLEERVHELEQKLESESQKLRPEDFDDFWDKGPKKLTKAALTDLEVSMRYPRFVLQAKVLRVTFWMMIATFAMAVTTFLMAAATYLE